MVSGQSASHCFRAITQHHPKGSLDLKKCSERRVGWLFETSDEQDAYALTGHQGPPEESRGHHVHGGVLGPDLVDHLQNKGPVIDHYVGVFPRLRWALQISGLISHETIKDPGRSTEFVAHRFCHWPAPLVGQATLLP